MSVSRNRVLACALLVWPLTASAQTHVASGGDLQAAINGATAGQTITLEAAATFTGNFTLPAHAGAAIIIRTVTTDVAFTTGLVNPTTHGALMPIIRTTNGTAALRTVGEASDWTLIGLILEANNAVQNSVANIVILGDVAITSADDLPSNITIDRCVIRAVSGGSAHRGIQQHVRNIIIRKSYFEGIRSTAAESHATSTWNSPGPMLFEDNYIEAASIGVLFGGAASAISGTVPSDIIFRRNVVTRPLAWKEDTGYGFKNLFELKNAQRVQIYGNLFEHNWVDGQSGFGIVFTVRANSQSAPWSTIADVDFHSNIVRHVASVFNILGTDDTAPSVTMNRVAIRNNLIYGIDRQVWDSPGGTLGAGLLAQIDGGPQNLTIEYNTVQGAVTGNVMVLLGNPIGGFVFRRNIVQKQTQATGFPFDTFGIFGNGVGEGNIAISTFAPNVGGFPNTIVENNVLAGMTSATYNNWTVNLFPTVATLHADFLSMTHGNFRLVPGSSFTGYGANLDGIEVARGLRRYRTSLRFRE